MRAARRPSVLPTAPHTHDITWDADIDSSSLRRISFRPRIPLQRRLFDFHRRIYHSSLRAARSHSALPTSTACLTPPPNCLLCSPEDIEARMASRNARARAPPARRRHAPKSLSSKPNYMYRRALLIASLAVAEPRHASFISMTHARHACAGRPPFAADAHTIMFTQLFLKHISRFIWSYYLRRLPLFTPHAMPDAIYSRFILSR